MFKNLTDFSYKRSGKQAFGFYLAYFLVVLILCGIGGTIGGWLSGSSSFSEGFAVGQRIGPVIACVYCLTISCLLLAQRKLYKNFGFLLLALLSALLGFVGGGLLGMIIPAVMTTRGSAK